MDLFVVDWEGKRAYRTVSVGAIKVLVVVEITRALCVWIIVATLVYVTVIVVKLAAVEVVLSELYDVTVCVPMTLVIDVAVMD